MEEHIVSINKAAAVHLYKSCKWNAFVYCVMMVFGAISLFLTIYLLAFGMEFTYLQHQLVEGWSQVVYICYGVLYIIGSLFYCVLGAYGYRYTQKCKQALLVGDSDELEKAFYTGRIYAQIKGITLLVTLSLIVLLLIVFGIFYFALNNGIF